MSNSFPRRSDPACETCCKRCRKCDRARQHCNRFVGKGLICEGYPTQFKVLDLSTGPRKPRQRPGGRRRTTTEKVRRTTIDLSATSPSLGVAIAESPTSTRALGSDASSSQATSTPKVLQKPSSASPSSVLSTSSQLDEILIHEQTHEYLLHSLCDILSTFTTIRTSPFRSYVLPLAYQHTGLLHAVLGLAACHITTSGIDNSPKTNTAALEHKLLAIQSLSSLLLKEECFGLDDIEEELSLAIVLILVLHDICESGKSLHGAHLNGVAFLCAKIVTRPDNTTPSKRFLLAVLSWLDILRGFTGAENLAFSPSVREFVVKANDFSLETVVGCPVELFHRIGVVLEAGKAYLAHEVPVEAFEEILEDAEDQLRKWNLHQNIYPTPDPEWKLLADAYRHVCLLRVLRFPDTFRTPCTEPKIKQSVDSILEACARVPWSSHLYKRFLFPLFMAGADTTSLHQQHYVRWCIAEILRSTKFPQPAVMDILNNVWRERALTEQSLNGPANVPWMEYTCSTSLRRQHDYLFF